MKPIRRILIGLDMSELDALVIKFASFMSRSSPTRAFYFVNIIKNLHIPKEVKKDFPELVKTAVKERRKQIKSLVDDNLTIHPDSTKKILVKDGDPAKEILKLIDQLKIDLVVLGRKPNEERSGVTIQRLARRAGCNLLIVPKGTEGVLNDERQLKKLLVATDFSKHSELAMEHAVNIVRNTNTKRKIEVYCQHVYSVPTGYHYTGKSYEDFAEIIRKNAEKSYKKFIKKVDTKGIKIIPVYTLDKNENIAEDIYHLAQEIEADGIIFGARGISATSALFIGSFAEKMIKMDTSIPFLVVRKSGENQSFLDYLRKF